MTGRNVTICPSLRKMRSQEAIDWSALPPALQTHGGQKGNQKWSGGVYQKQIMVG